MIYSSHPIRPDNIRAQRPLIVGLGECLWDVLPTGKLRGGAPANFAYHASRLGGRGLVVSAVGDDTLGRALLADIGSIGLSREHIQVTPNHPTSTVTVQFAPDGQPQYLIHENVAWDFLTNNPSLNELAAQADCVCIGTLAQRSPQSRAAIQRFIAGTRPQCLRIFDINLRQHFYDRQVLLEGLTACDILKLNDQEWQVVARLFNVDLDWAAGLRQLRSRFDLRLIALTRGAEGSLLCDEHEMHELPAKRITVVDTIGAGDAFTASLAMDLIRGAPLPDMHARATEVAGFVCSHRGATPEISLTTDDPDGCESYQFKFIYA